MFFLSNSDEESCINQLHGGLTSYQQIKSNFMKTRLSE